MPRTIRAPRGTQLTCKNWLIEAAYRTKLRNPLTCRSATVSLVHIGRSEVVH